MALVRCNSTLFWKMQLVEMLRLVVLATLSGMISAQHGEWDFLQKQNYVPTAPVHLPAPAPAPAPPTQPAKPDPFANPRPYPTTPAMLAGTWYTQVYVPPCSWSGAQDFSNFMQVIYPEKNRIKLVDEFRSEGECSTTTASLLVTDVPGVFTFKDSVGGLNSGDYVIVAIEEICFQVVWSCVKRHVESGKCKDYWVAAKTRKRVPDALTWKKIGTVLQHIGIQNYEPVNQSQPCSAPLKKTY